MIRIYMITGHVLSIYLYLFNIFHYTFEFFYHCWAFTFVINVRVAIFSFVQTMLGNLEVQLHCDIKVLFVFRSV